MSDQPYVNRAKVDNQKDEVFQDCTDFECCHEEIVFSMKDNYHEFSLGLSTILECLSIAEHEGYVPRLSHDWWNSIRNY